MKKNITSAVLVVASLMFVGAGAFFVSESRAESKTYKIGEKGPAGGWIFYDKGNTSDGWRYLEAAPVDQSTSAKWGCFEESRSGAMGKAIRTGKAISTGKANTAAIIESCGESGIAAKIASDYRGGDKSDWFLPSRDELNLMYENLHKKGVGGFSDYSYWSSSEITVGLMWYQCFDDGNQGYLNRAYPLSVRAVRAF